MPPWMACEEAVAVLGFVARQHAAGEERHDGQRHEQRGRHRAEHRHRQRAGELAGAFGQERQRQEGEQQLEVQPMTATAISRVPSIAAVCAVLALAQVPGDVFGDDDRVVDQQAKRDDEPRDRQLVERKAGKASTATPMARLSGTDTIDHDEARQPSGSSVSSTSASAMAKSRPSWSSFRAMSSDWSKPRSASHRAAIALGICRRLHGAVADVEDVQPVLLGQRHPDGALAVEAAIMRLFLITPADLGDIADAHHPAVAGAHRFIGDFGDAAKGAASLNVQALVAGMDGAGRQVGRPLPQRIGDGGNRQAELRHAARIDGDAQLGRRDGMGAGVADARHLVQPFAQVLGVFFQPAIRRGIADQRELDDGGFGGAGLFDSTGAATPTAAGRGWRSPRARPDRNSSRGRRSSRIRR